MEYIFDDNQVRYQCVQNDSLEDLNWLFFPGGPGADSQYLMSLVKLLDISGNIWLIDMPGNGSNIHNIPDNYDLDTWLAIFPSIIQKFRNPICVGHSFGAMLPLLYPEMENYFLGLVVLNSAPCLWLEAAVKKAKERNLPDLTPAMSEFTQNPNNETFKNALAACMPYYFPAHSIENGWMLLKNIPFEYLPAVWWQQKAIEINFNAKWIPNNVPMLIIGGEYDSIVPLELFKDDNRFQRKNINIVEIKNAGHMPWIENSIEIKQLFQSFAKTCQQYQRGIKKNETSIC